MKVEKGRTEVKPVHGVDKMWVLFCSQWLQQQLTPLLRSLPSDRTLCSMMPPLVICMWRCQWYLVRGRQSLFTCSPMTFNTKVETFSPDALLGFRFGQFLTISLFFPNGEFLLTLFLSSVSSFFSTFRAQFGCFGRTLGEAHYPASLNACIFSCCHCYCLLHQEVTHTVSHFQSLGNPIMGHLVTTNSITLFM